MDHAETLVTIENLSIGFGGQNYVTGVDLSLRRGEILGLVGESGSGKTLTASAIAGILPKTALASGSVAVDGVEVSAAVENLGSHAPARFAAVVFQNPMVSFNPYFTLGRSISDVIIQHRSTGTKPMKRRDAMRIAAEIFDQVRLEDPSRQLAKYPHEFSGGQLQRAMVAMALASEPDILICDEPTTALDVTIQKEIIDLIMLLVRERQLACLFVTHDLNVAGMMCDNIAVMKSGKIIERGAARDILVNPTEDYTRKLVAATPRFTRSDAADVATGDVLVTTTGLNKTFDVAGIRVQPTQDVSLEIARGDALGLVGESGSGKSTLANLLLRMEDADSGEIHFDGVNIVTASRDELQAMRARVGVVYQNPYSSLNPRMRIRDIIGEPLIVRGGLSRAEIDKRVIEAAQKARVDIQRLDRKPNAFSGGQRQRIAIARAIINRPEFLVLDEPTSSLDVSVQAQIIELLRDLKAEMNLTCLFISHDLAIVRSFCNRVLVMAGGRIVEQGDVEAVFESPQTDYTARLIAAIPQPHDRIEKEA